MFSVPLNIFVCLCSLKVLEQPNLFLASNRRLVCGRTFNDFFKLQVMQSSLGCGIEPICPHERLVAKREWNLWGKPQLYLTPFCGLTVLFGLKDVRQSSPLPIPLAICIFPDCHCVVRG